MSNWGFDENDGNANNGLGNTTEGNGPKALRDAYEKQKATIDSLEAKVTAFIEAEERRQMSTVFESLGVPGAQAVYQGPADPIKAKEWVDTMKATFGGQPQQAANEVPAVPALPASMQNQFDRLTQAGSEGAPIGNVEAAHAAVNDANNLQGIIDSFKNLGA